MKRKVKIKKYTLIEFLIVGSMLLFLLTFLITFFNKGTQLCKQFSTQGYSNQQIKHLKNKWRKFIHECDSDFITTYKDGKSFVSGKKSVSVSKDHIDFVTLKKTESIKLSKNMNVTFDVDYSTEIPLIIMNVKLSSPFPGENDENVRIVACPRGCTK